MRVIGRALFLDLDGTLIVTKSGMTFPKDKYDWEFNGDILKRIEKYVDDDYFVMIVTNQGGIESGKVRMNDFRDKIAKIRNQVIIETGCAFSRIGHRFCITNTKDDFHRKPNPGMGYDLAIAYDLNLSESLMIGDASGEVRRTESVFWDITSPSFWSYKNGSFVADVDTCRLTKMLTSTSGWLDLSEERSGLIDISIAQKEIKEAIIEFRDFSDSDKMFAKACGMPYMDIKKFLSSEK